MGSPEPGAKVAKDLGIYLGQVYNYIKKGLVTNHKAGGYPEGKGVEVDPDEVRAAMSKSRRKGGGPGKGKSGYVRKSERKSKGDEPETPKVRGRRLPTGTIVSYAQGQMSTDHIARAPRYTLSQVLGTTGKLTFLDSANRRQHYTGTVLDHIIFPTERLSTMLARGVARIEKPNHVLGYVLLSFVAEDRVDLASSLERWMEKHGLEVVVPEILDLEPEGDEDEESRAVEDD